MRFHCLGLPHTVTNIEYVGCAYTQKVLKFCKMMKARGHYIIHYGHEDSDVICDEHVTVSTNKDLEIAYGNYDWRNSFFKFDVQDHAYQTFFKNAIEEVGKRKEKNDFILPFWGSGVRPICDAHQDMICVEPGIGYAGGHWARWKIFESYAVYHAYCNLTACGTCKQDWYEAVIPNYFDLNDFDYCEEKDDYFLFLGRVYEGKGIHIAIQITQEIGVKLIVAGQQSLKSAGIECPPHVTEVGYADRDTRKRLMSKAKCGIVASMYVEPFGGVQMEMLLSGTPTITTDWGSFTENNIHGVTGYRCRTFEQFCWAGRNIDKIRPADCRNWALNFSLEKVSLMYEEYFQMVLDVYDGPGWYQKHPERESLGWLDKNISVKEPVFPSKELDFLEIGTSDFSFESDPLLRGIYVEPVSEYINRLPNHSNKLKVQAAITHNKKKSDCEIYYVPSFTITENNLPDWMRGCNCIDEYHVQHENIKHLVQKETIPLLNIKEFLEKYNIKKIKTLKIDTEGHDCVILQGLYEYNCVFPDNIIFESNELTPEEEVTRIINLLKTIGYEVVTRGYNTHLKFNTLQDIFLRHGTDKYNNHENGHTYHIKYNELFYNKRHENIKLFEMGIGSIQQGPSSMYDYHHVLGYMPGSSHRAWREYFTHPETKIYGGDIDESICDEKMFFKVNQLDPLELEKVFEKVGECDIIVDDGLHTQEASKIMFETCWKYIKPGGVYVIEDINIEWDHPDLERWSHPKKCGHVQDNYLNIFIKKPRVAIFSQKGWAFGRIHYALIKYMKQFFDFEYFDWANGEHCERLFKKGEWKNYDIILGNTIITYAPVETGWLLVVPQEYLNKCIAVGHTSAMNHPFFKEVIKNKDGPLYCGITQEVVDAIWDTYQVKCDLTPIGIDLDNFYPTRKVTEIKRAGIIGDPDNWTDLKRLDMFKEICEKAGIEPVYIFGKDKDLNNKLYEGLDLFMYCSTKEGAGLGILEAACCGIPVITTKVGYSMYLKNIKTFDTVDEAVALIQWLGEDTNIKEYTEKLHNEIKNEWNWKFICEKYWKPVFEKRLK